MLNKIRIINQLIFQKHAGIELPMIYTLIGVSKSEEGPHLMHKSVIGVLTPECLPDSILMLFIEGKHILEMNSILEDMDIRVILHSAEGNLMGDIIEPQDIWDLIAEACKRHDIPSPIPLEKGVIKLPFTTPKGGLKS